MARSGGRWRGGQRNRTTGLGMFVFCIALARVFSQRSIRSRLCLNSACQVSPIQKHGLADLVPKGLGNIHITDVCTSRARPHHRLVVGSYSQHLCSAAICRTSSCRSVCFILFDEVAYIHELYYFY